MTRRQRVLQTIRHEIPDRVPIDLGVHFSTGISAFAYHHLREYLGMPLDKIEVADGMQLLARVEQDVLEKFHCDCILLNTPWKDPVAWNPRGDYQFLMQQNFQADQDEHGNWIARYKSNTARMPAGGFFFDGEWTGLSDYENFQEMIRETVPRAERLYKETDYFTMLMGFSAFFDGIEFACDMYTDPDAVIATQKERLTKQIERMKLVLRHLGGYIQAIEVNGDMGMQSGPMLDPAMFEEFCYPYLKAFCGFVHDNSDIKIFLHSCGAIEPLIAYLIDAGVDILNPVQISAADMDPSLLKKKYGKGICFWGGGCDTQNVLGTGTPEDVRKNVRELMRVFKPGGGFVFNQVHNIMGNVPPENITAMLETAYEESAY